MLRNTQEQLGYVLHKESSFNTSGCAPKNLANSFPLKQVCAFCSRAKALSVFPTGLRQSFISFLKSTNLNNFLS